MNKAWAIIPEGFDQNKEDNGSMKLLLFFDQEEAERYRIENNIRGAIEEFEVK